MRELPKTYDPVEVEARLAAWWEERGVFHAEPNDDGEPWSLVIPPPNYVEIGVARPLIDEASQRFATFGDAVRVVESSDQPACTRSSCRPNIRAGLRLFMGNGSPCTSGFSVEYRGSVNASSSAAHCGQPPVRHGGYQIASSGISTIGGSRDLTVFPLGCCYVSLPSIFIDNTNNNSGVSSIASESQYPIGGAICKSGASSNISCGTISDPNYSPCCYIPNSFDFLRAKICIAGGDSGGPAFASSIALGIVSGANILGCTSDGKVVDQGQRAFFSKARNLESMADVRVKLR